MNLNKYLKCIYNKQEISVSVVFFFERIEKVFLYVFLKFILYNIGKYVGD